MTNKELKEKYPKYRDRILHMSNKQIAARTLLLFVIMCVITIFLYVFLNGMPIFDIPGKGKITQIEVISHRLTDETLVLTEEADIKYLRDTMEFVNTEFNGDEVSNPGDPIVTLKLTTKDGKVYEISANETVVFWNGKAMPLHKDGDYVTLIEAVCFPDYADLTKLTAEQ